MLRHDMASHRTDKRRIAEHDGARVFWHKNQDSDEHPRLIVSLGRTGADRWGVVVVATRSRVRGLAANLGGKEHSLHWEFFMYRLLMYTTEIIPVPGLLVLRCKTLYRIGYPPPLHFRVDVFAVRDEATSPLFSPGRAQQRQPVSVCRGRMVLGPTRQQDSE